jgi:hypothetical protein
VPPFAVAQLEVQLLRRPILGKHSQRYIPAPGRSCVFFGDRDQFAANATVTMFWYDLKMGQQCHLAGVCPDFWFFGGLEP